MAQKDLQTDENRADESTHRTDSTEGTATPSRRRLLRLLGAGGVAGLAGCAGGEDSGDGTEPGTETATGTPTETELGLQESATIALPDDRLAHGPSTERFGGVLPYWTMSLEPLLWVGKDLDPQPWLAESWERTGEGVFEFTIREGVTFHNGAPLTAEEVVWSWKLLTEPGWAQEWLSLKPEDVTKVDDMTVEFTTSPPNEMFVGSGVTHNWFSIQHPDREVGNPIGTGPYTVEEIKKDQYVKVSAFDDYWRGPPTTSELTFREITDPNTRALALEGGKVDVAVQLPRTRVNSFRNTDKINVQTQMSTEAGFVEINTGSPPTDDVRLRKALNYAVSQEQLVGTVLNGVGEPARGHIVPLLYWSAHDSLPEYGPDQAKAKQLVEASAYNGETLQLYVEKGVSGGETMAQIIQQTASEIGVNISVKVVEGGAYREARNNGEGHLFFKENGPHAADGDWLLYGTFYSGYESSYSSGQMHQLGDQLNSLILKGHQAGDRETRIEAFGEAQKILMEKAALIPLYYHEYVVGSSSSIEGVDLRPVIWMMRFDDLKHFDQG